MNLKGKSNMQLRSTIILLIFMLFSTCNVEATKKSMLPMSAPGSTQFVAIMNALSNPAASELTKTNVMVRYYDGTGNHPPCWIEYNISYHSAPNVAGAGGRNACGNKYTSPQGIVKIDILPLRAPQGPFITIL